VPVPASSAKSEARSRSSPRTRTASPHCFNQDQSLDAVDFRNLNTRLRQNSAAEKLTLLWIDHLFAARLVQTV
jgi:hypothetical protein